jgi:hypothetical protein
VTRRGREPWAAYRARLVANGREEGYRPCCIRAFVRRQRHNQPSFNVWIHRWVSHRTGKNGAWRDWRLVTLLGAVPCRACLHRRPPRWAVISARAAGLLALRTPEGAPLIDPPPWMRLAVTRQPWTLRWPWRRRSTRRVA